MDNVLYSRLILILQRNCWSRPLPALMHHSAYHSGTGQRQRKRQKITAVNELSADDSSSSDSGGVPLYSKPDGNGSLESTQYVGEPIPTGHPRHKLQPVKNANNIVTPNIDIMKNKTDTDDVAELEQGLKGLTLQKKKKSKSSKLASAPQPKHVSSLYTPKGDLSIPPTTRVTRSQTKAFRDSQAKALQDSIAARKPLPLPVLPRPVPTAEYLEQACKPPSKTETPRPLLIIVDLNGCLIDRGKSRGSSGPLRPHLQQLLEYCLDNHKMMVWSSAGADNVRAMTNRIFSTHQKAPIAVWNRGNLHLTPAQARNKVQVYKQLQWVWVDKRIARYHPHAETGGCWDQTNTMLLDDSFEKAAAQPHNQLLVPEYKKENEKWEKESKILVKITEYIKEAALYEDVSTFIHSMPFEKWVDGTFEIRKLIQTGSMDLIEL